MKGRTLTKQLHVAQSEAESEHLPNLVALYTQTLNAAAKRATERFAITAAVDWQPPAEGAALTVAKITALATALNAKLSPVWTRILLDIAREPLARIEIVWDVKHPLARALLAQAGERTGARIGEASQFILRDALKQAYDEGLEVRYAAALIWSKMSEAAPWQAQMLARTDLNSLANGASKAAAQLTGMGFKTWDATLDAVTRPEHMEAHGQTVAIGDVFLVGGEEADYPGDPALSDAMAANCRCTLVYGETLGEAESLLASAGGGNIRAVATKEQRKRRYERRAAHSSGATATTTEAFLDWKDLTDSEARSLSVLLQKASPDAAIVAAPIAVRFKGVAAIEGLVADDNSPMPRVLLPKKLTWEEMPVPFMAQTVTAEGHDGAEVAGRVDKFTRKRGDNGTWLIAFEGELTTPFGINEIAPMIDDATLRGVSADLGASEWMIVDRQTLEQIPEADLNVEAMADGDYALGLVAGKIRAVTLTPVQALEGANVALAASADSALWSQESVLSSREEGVALVASPAPFNPPREWFETAEPPGVMPLTVTEDGRVYGHMATWESCHVSFLPSCVPPPKSASNYAYFHVCELDTVEGETVTVGKLMFSPGDGGHADRTLTASKASAYYDRTGMAAAYLRVIDGAHGIWAAGSLNPDLNDEQRQEMRRQLRLHPPSGDWRPINGQYELICGLAVAVPGFPVPRAVMTVTASADGVELSEALIASSGVFEADPAALVALEHLGLVDEDAQAEREMRALAARAEGMDSLAALVKT